MAKINFESENQGFKTITPNSKYFTVSDGPYFFDRASIEITRDCPDSVLHIIADAYRKGWIRPLAHVTERDYFHIVLSDE